MELAAEDFIRLWKLDEAVTVSRWASTLERQCKIIIGPYKL
jgi:hypothetical protein